MSGWTAGADPALLLTYGQFRALLPATLSPEAQQGLRAVGPLSVLKTAGPGTGTWPAIDFLTAARPQLALWPLETTYPPGVAAHLEKQTATARIEAAAAAEIVTDGERFWLVRHSPVSPTLGAQVENEVCCVVALLPTVLRIEASLIRFAIAHIEE